MFEKLKEKIRLLTTPAAPFDPDRFNDPLARKTGCTPCS